MWKIHRADRANPEARSPYHRHITILQRCRPKRETTASWRISLACLCVGSIERRHIRAQRVATGCVSTLGRVLRIDGHEMETMGGWKFTALRFFPKHRRSTLLYPINRHQSGPSQALILREGVRSHRVEMGMIWLTFHFRRSYMVSILDGLRMIHSILSYGTPPLQRAPEYLSPKKPGANRDHRYSLVNLRALPFPAIES